MKKFENPKMTISKFVTENIITTSGEVQKTKAVTAANTWLSEQGADNIFYFSL